MGGYLLALVTWLAISVYGTSVIFRELQPLRQRLRFFRATGVPVPAAQALGVWGAGVGGSLAWTTLLGITALRIFS